MDNLHIVVTEQMVAKFPRLKPLKGRKFFLRQISAAEDGCCMISGRAFTENAYIGYARVKEGDKFYTLTAFVGEVQKQMKDGTPGVGYYEPQKFTNSIEQYRIPADLISDEQEECVLIFEHDKCNLIMESRAGGGKTSMLKDLASRAKMIQVGPVNRLEKFIYMAFNSKNAKEGAKKLPKSVPSMTTHSFMGGVIRNNGLKIPVKADQTKTTKIINDIFPHLSNSKRKKIRRATKRLIPLAKAFACNPNDTDKIASVMGKYGFDLETPEDYTEVVNLTSTVLTLSLPVSKYGLVYNYDDMLWWPIVMDMTFPKYDCVFADECQDFNDCQIEMMLRLGLAGARLVIVGDPYQAVYRFRGANSEAFGKLCKVLEDGQRKAKRVLLPTNYRCGKTIIDYVVANTHVKDIKAAPNAPLGMVRVDMTYRQILDMIINENKGVAA